LKKGRLSQEQIEVILKALENGRPAAELAKEYGVSLGSVYMWRAKFGGTNLPPDAARLNRLDDENRRLKCLVADLMLENQALKQVLNKHGEHS
jgi:putative transposase